MDALAGAGRAGGGVELCRDRRHVGRCDDRRHGRVEHAQLAHPFSLLPKMGLTEDDLLDDHLSALCAAASATGTWVEVNEKWACPGPQAIERLCGRGRHPGGVQRQPSSPGCRQIPAGRRAVPMSRRRRRPTTPCRLAGDDGVDRCPHLGADGFRDHRHDSGRGRPIPVSARAVPCHPQPLCEGSAVPPQGCGCGAGVERGCRRRHLHRPAGAVGIPARSAADLRR